MKYIRHELPRKKIELCLNLFDTDEATRRILRYIEGVLECVESQLKYQENNSESMVAVDWIVQQKIKKNWYDLHLDINLESAKIYVREARENYPSNVKFRIVKRTLKEEIVNENV